MSGKTVSDRKTLRRQASVDEIVAEAWELSRANGLGNFSMRELGDRVGMRAQSLYSYFASKMEIFDAMFLRGNEQLLETMRSALDATEDGDDPVATGITIVDTFVRFCTSDPIRYQLLFQRTIPDFVPSEQSFAIAQEAYDLSVGPLRALGLDGTQLDLCTAVMAGLVAQQISNDPGGDRWVRLTRQATTMLLHELVPDLFSHTNSTRSTP
jgi:AcrR family transcriptional regulator